VYGAKSVDNQPSCGFGREKSGDGTPDIRGTVLQA